MNVNPNDPAMPIKGVGFNVESEEIAMHEQHADFKVNFPGMSIRTELAARAMEGVIAGMLSNPKIKIGKPGELERSIAEVATKMADALIAELNKPTASS